jgi:hypothetical protein
MSWPVFLIYLMHNFTFFITKVSQHNSKFAPKRTNRTVVLSHETNLICFIHLLFVPHTHQKIYANTSIYLWGSFISDAQQHCSYATDWPQSLLRCWSKKSQLSGSQLAASASNSEIPSKSQSASLFDFANNQLDRQPIALLSKIPPPPLTLQFRGTRWRCLDQPPSVVCNCRLFRFTCHTAGRHKLCPR